MGTILCSRYRYSEMFSAGTIFTEELDGKHDDNTFLNDYKPLVSNQLLQLQQSIAFHEQDSLAKEGEELEKSFKRSYVNFRKMSELFAQMDNLGEASEKCKEIAAILKHHDRDLHLRPRDELITLFDSVLTECDYLDEDSVINATPDVKTLFLQTMEDHSLLKTLEQQRSNVAQTAETIPAPSELAKEMTPYISKIYRHLTDYAYIENPEYLETLQAIDVRLAPIITRVKARLTRAEHELGREDVTVEPDSDTALEQDG